MQHQIGSFAVEVRDDGVAIVTFSRPPVNSVSLSVYEDIGRLTAQLQADERRRHVQFDDWAIEQRHL